MDRALIGQYVSREVESRMSWTDFATQSNVSRATLHRVVQADPRVTIQVFRRIERGLSLPFDTLTTVGVHDWHTLREWGVGEEVLRWLEKKASILSASDAPPSTRKPSRRATRRA